MKEQGVAPTFGDIYISGHPGDSLGEIIGFRAAISEQISDKSAVGMDFHIVPSNFSSESRKKVKEPLFPGNFSVTYQRALEGLLLLLSADKHGPMVSLRLPYFGGTSLCLCGNISTKPKLTAIADYASYMVTSGTSFHYDTKDGSVAIGVNLSTGLKGLFGIGGALNYRDSLVYRLGSFVSFGRSTLGLHFMHSDDTSEFRSEFDPTDFPTHGTSGDKPIPEQINQTTLSYTYKCAEYTTVGVSLDLIDGFTLIDNKFTFSRKFMQSAFQTTLRTDLSLSSIFSRRINDNVVVSVYNRLDYLNRSYKYGLSVEVG